MRVCDPVFSLQIFDLGVKFYDIVELCTRAAAVLFEYTPWTDNNNNSYTRETRSERRSSLHFSSIE